MSNVIKESTSRVLVGVYAMLDRLLVGYTFWIWYDDMRDGWGDEVAS
jgi:hypothetical protein